MGGHTIEFFFSTPECELCSETLAEVRKATDECGCDVTERRYGESREMADKYGVSSLPSMVVDEKLVHVGRVTAEKFKEYID